MNYGNQNHTFAKKIKRFCVDMLDTFCECINSNDNAEAPCNLHALEIPADFSEKRLNGGRLSSQKLTWLPAIEIMAVITSVIVVFILTSH